MTAVAEAAQASPEAERAIAQATVAAAALGVVLSPIPLADELALLPIYGWLTLRVARAHALAPRDVPWKPLAKTAVVGLAARAALNVGVSYIPGVAALANATTGAALTQIYGACAMRACADPSRASALGLRDVVEALRARLKR